MNFGVNRVFRQTYHLRATSSRAEILTAKEDQGRG